MAQCLLEQNTIEFFKFLDKCTDEMLLHDQKQLDENLLEAINHKIVIKKVNEQGKTILSMPFTRDVIKEFTQKEEEDF